MEERYKLAQEITIAEGLQLLATAYEEISVMKMRLARDSVLHTRTFLSSLSEVFVNVKNSYTKKLDKQGNNKNGSVALKFATHKKNGQATYVLLSAANKLYGDIVSKTFALFKEMAEKNPTADIVIIGKAGKELYEQAFPNRKCTFFDLPDIVPSIEILKPIINHMLEYEHVTVFYGRFVNVVTQEAVA